VSCNFKLEKIFYILMSMMIYPEITFKKGREAALLRGHPWVFSGAIAAIKGNPGAGDIQQEINWPWDFLIP
jgi:hypothetical protein